MPSQAGDIAAVLALIDRTRARPGRRRLVGIAGPPGSGKSTLAADVVAALNMARPGQAVLVPMDGFHMDNATLDRAGLRAVKGAPQTFDVAGFIAKVAELAPEGVAGNYPLFDRDADSTLPDAARVAPEVGTLVIEGNYLLLSDPPWSDLAKMFDTTVILRPDLATIEARLLARWRALGLPPEAVHNKTYNNDMVNACHVLSHSAPADLTLTQEPPPC